MNILVVIPARGGSKGIPRKNIRFMNGKPLIAYAINNGLKLGDNVDCVVTTDDDEISYISKFYGAEVVNRNNGLSMDNVTLDPVIFDAVTKSESIFKKAYDIVITLQPTSPLLNIETLKEAIKYFIENRKDTIISVVNKPHLSWTKINSKIKPNYVQRLNRQELPPNYLETGAFLITKREFITKKSRLGHKLDVFEVAEEESIDIDSYNDWIICESILRRKNIVFRVDGTKERGLGHIYNCITMAFSFPEHNILIVTKQDAIEGLKKIKSTNLPYMMIRNDYDIDDVIEKFKPDIWVNDCLDTNKEYIEFLKTKIGRVVTIEDLGEGRNYADAVINAIYDASDNDKVVQANQYWGSEYICLREEFLLSEPKTFSEKVNNILIMFGGTDSSNLNFKLYKLILKIADEYNDIKFNFITGIGYDYKQNGILNLSEKNIFVTNDCRFVTKYMQEADLAFSSQGRTIFELACMRIPTVIMAQNQREITHRFAQMENGFLNLGLGINVSEKTLENTIRWLIETPSIRYNMHKLMEKWNFTSNTSKIKKIIIGDNND